MNDDHDVPRGRVTFLIWTLAQVLYLMAEVLHESARFEQLVDAVVGYLREAEKPDPDPSWLDEYRQRVIDELERMDGAAAGGPLPALIFDDLIDAPRRHDHDTIDLHCLFVALLQALPLLPESAELAAATEVLVAQTELREPDRLEVLWAAGDAVYQLSEMADQCIGGPLVHWLLDRLTERSY